MALLQTSVRSATPWICELNLAEMAQNVSSNGANAADCRQRRKCLRRVRYYCTAGLDIFTHLNAPVRRFEVCVRGFIVRRPNEGKKGIHLVAQRSTKLQTVDNVRQ